MKKVLLLTLIILGCYSSASAASTYYISSAIGSDTNTSTQAKVKTTPWAHAPGMANCTSACASYSPVAGDQFIFRGGDSWTSSSMPWNFTWAGSSGSLIYIGVDQTWFTGGSWVRPVITCSSSCSQQFSYGTSGNFVQLDNLEFTGMRNTASTPCFGCVYAVNTHDISGTLGSATHVIVSNNYFHGACMASDGPQQAVYILGWPNSDTLSEVKNNVFDNSDGKYFTSGSCGSIPATFYSMCGLCGGVGNVYNNYFGHMSNGNVAAGEKDYHGNIIDTIGNSIDNLSGGAGDDHENGMESNAECGMVAYNNVVMNVPFNGIVLFQFSPNSGCTSYGFNNIFFNNDAPNGMQCYESSGGGNCQFFNNTAQCGPTGSNNICGRATGTGHGTWTNNHFMTTSSPAIAGGSVTLTNNTQQTQAAANGQGYNVSQTYVYSPTASSNATVTAAGTNETSVLCSSVASLNSAAGTACRNDSAYSCVYDMTAHAMNCPARAVNARPASGSWNTGAYQFTSSSSPVASFTPTSFSFPDQKVTTSSPATVITLTNTGTATLNISSISITGTNSADFSQTTSCGATLAITTSCSINVTFTPSAVGTRTASVSVSDDAPGSPQTVPLAGNGIIVVPHQPVLMSSFPAGTVAVSYSNKLTVTGDTPPDVWSINPTVPGLTLNTSTGVLSGTPMTSGTYALTAVVTDSYQCGANDLPGCTNTSAPYSTNLVINAATPPPPSKYVLNSSPTSLTFTGQVGGSIACQNMTADDTTPKPLPIALTTDSGWLTITPGVGNTKLPTSVCVKTAGLAAGVQNGNIIITTTTPNNGYTVNNSPLKVPVKLTLTAPPPPAQTLAGCSVTSSTTTSLTVSCTINNIFKGQTSVIQLNPTTGTKVTVTHP